MVFSFAMLAHVYGHEFRTTGANYQQADVASGNVKELVPVTMTTEIKTIIGTVRMHHHETP
jgi:hypothetical protein